jgi:hypothetical protein
MFTFEALVASQPEAQKVEAAFYRCIERLGEGKDGEAYMRTEQLCDGQLITIRLWSAEALDELRSEVAKAIARTPRRRLS